MRHHPAARGQRSIIDRQTAAKAGAVPPALFLLRPQNCGAVAHALADTGRVEDDRKLSRFYNGFYLQGDRSTTYTERAADCKLARLVGRPSKKGRWATMTHDYKRHGTTTLFAALNVLEGKIIGRCMQRHRHQEFIRFLNTIEADIPAGKIIHVVLDNYATHKHAKVRAWLDRHPRFVFHYTPTSPSWLNAVEGFFAKLTKRRLKRGVFRSIVDLQAAISRFLKETNDDPKPFVWTADPDKIIAAVKRGYQTLDLIHWVY